MAIEALLPKLKEVNAPPRGEWRDDHISGLGRLAKDVELGAEGDVLRFDSVPDLWAPLVQFDALLAAGNPEAEAMFRGLFAFWALGPGRRIPHDLVSLSLTDAASVGFLNVALKLRPEGIVCSGERWERLGVMRLGGGPIARPLCVFNPLTVFAPARGWREALDVIGTVDVPWYDRRARRFTDPIEQARLTRSELRVLHSAAVGLVGALRDIGSDGLARNQAVYNRYLGLIDRIRSRLEEAKGVQTVGPPELDGSPRFQGEMFSNPRLNQVFGWRLKVASETPPVFIPARERTVEGQSRRVIRGGFMLADLAVAEALDRGDSADDVPFWGPHTLAAVCNPRSGALEAVRAEAATHGYVVLTADDVFTAHHFTIINNSQIKEHTPHSGIILPIQPLVLGFMQPKEIVANLSFEELEGGVLRACLRIPVERPGQYPTYVRLTKDYPPENRRSMRAPGMLAVWPNFHSVTWPFYLLSSYNLEHDREFHLVGGLDLVRLDEILNTGDGLADLAQGAPTAYVLDRLRATRRRRSMDLHRADQSSDRERGIEHLFHPPEAAVMEAFDIMNASTDPIRPNHPKVRAGLVLIGPYQPSAVRGGNSKFVVGVDFGTTNTCVYHKTDLRDPAPLEFRDRTLTPFQGGSATAIAEQNGWLLRHFVPNSIGRPPFLTALKRRPVAVPETAPLAKASGPLWSHLIFYNANITENLSVMGEAEQQDFLSFGLKWNDRNRTDRADARASVDTRAQDRGMFLRQIVVQSLVEAAFEGYAPHNVQFRFSLPEAFTIEEKTRFNAEIRQACERPFGTLPEGIGTRIDSDPYRNLSAPGVQFDGEPGATGFTYEASCATRYFTNNEDHRARINGTMLVIDVGGGTTDYQLIHRGKTLWRDSVRFAGQDILIAPLMRRDIVQGLYNSSNETVKSAAKQILDQISKNARAERQIQALELMVNDREDNFRRSFEELVGQNDPVAMSVVNIAALSFGAILWYAGMMLKELSNPNSEVAPAMPRIEQPPNRVDICFAGRGALIMWNILTENPYHAPLKAMFLDAAGLPPTCAVQFHIPKEPKTEVAAGLLFDDTQQAARLEVPCPSILGEAVVVGGHDLLPAGHGVASLNNLELGWALPPPDRLTNLRPYLDALARHLGINMLNQDRMVRWIDDVNDLLERERMALQQRRSWNEAADNSSLHYFEPVFFTAIKALVKLTSRESGDRPNG